MFKLKKLLAMGLAAVMTLGLCAPAMAEETTGTTEVTGRFPETTGTLTISNPTEGETYNAYQMLILASFADTKTATDYHATDRYAYVIHKDSAWKNFIETANDGNTEHKLFTIDTTLIALENGGSADYYIVEPTEYFANPLKDVTDSRDETSNPKWTSVSLAQKFAQQAVNYAKTHDISPTANGVGPESGSLILSTDGSGEEAKQQLPLGYYVIDSTLGTLCSLDTLNPNVEVYEKNVKPTINKEVQEDSAATTVGDSISGYTDVDDGDIGDTIYYRTLINVQKGAQDYVLHDKMDSGLTWTGEENLKVYLLNSTATLDSMTGWTELKAGTTVTINTTTDQTEKTYTGTNKTDFYTVTANASHVEGATATTDTFDVTLNKNFQTFLNDRMDANDETKFVRLMVVYSAVLNETAVVNDSTANKNVTRLTYGDNSKTADDTTSTATWEVDLYKYTLSNSSAAAAALDGAFFQITKGNSTLKFVKTEDGKYRYDSRNAIQNANIESHTDREIGTTTVPDPDDSSKTLTVVDTITTKDGKLYITGLDGDQYTLIETLAPAGYNKLTAPIPFHITSVSEGKAGQISYYTNEQQTATAKATEGDVLKGTTSPFNGIATTITKSEKVLDIQLDVENKAGAELPSTGGMGTTMFYVLGSILMVGAGIVLVSRRRMSF